MISFEELSLLDAVGGLLRARFSFDRFNARGVTDRISRRPDDLVATLERQIEPGRISRIGRGLPALADALVHHQDIRRPLGHPRVVPAGGPAEAIVMALAGRAVALNDLDGEGKELLAGRC